MTNQIRLTTIEDANGYFAFRLNADEWERLDELVNADGEPIGDKIKAQALATAEDVVWPLLRQPVEQPTPRGIVAGIAELALHLLDPPHDGATVERVRVGPSDTRFRARVPDDLPREARRFLAPFLREPSAHGAPLVP